MKNLIQVFQDTLGVSSCLEPGITTVHSNLEINGPYKSLVTKNIKVINTDTVSAIIEYSEVGKTSALNMASYKRPGGGVDRGARAQEEGLFRCSNLCNSIPAILYPLNDDICLYTKNAIFFKDKDYNYMQHVTSDIMSVSAINLNSDRRFRASDYEKITLDKIRLMLTIPAINGVKNVILGAFGCGVFKNDPNIMSDFFKRILIYEGYSSLYENVIFAIINDHNSISNNYEIFSNTFKK